MQSPPTLYPRSPSLPRTRARLFGQPPHLARLNPPPPAKPALPPSPRLRSFLLPRGKPKTRPGRARARRILFSYPAGKPKTHPLRTPPYRSSSPPRCTRTHTTTTPCRLHSSCTLPNPCARRCVVPTRQVSDFPTNRQANKPTSWHVGKLANTAPVPRTTHTRSCLHTLLPLLRPAALAACLYPPPPNSLRSVITLYPLRSHHSSLAPPALAFLLLPPGKPRRPCCARARRILFPLPRGKPLPTRRTHQLTRTPPTLQQTDFPTSQQVGKPTCRKVGKLAPTTKGQAGESRGESRSPVARLNPPPLPAPPCALAYTTT